MNRDRAKEDVMSRVQFPCLWFDGNAEEAAELYVGVLPDSRITKVWRAPAETPSGPEGMVLTVDFTVGGQQLQGLTAGGGEPGPCGWLKDRFRLSGRSCRAGSTSCS